MIANALLTNQAVVKVVRSGGVTASDCLGGQLSCITRKGTVEMERGDPGELTHEVEALRDVQDEWAKDWIRMDARVTSYTYHLILSFPNDTDREAAKQAAAGSSRRHRGRVLLRRSQPDRKSDPPDCPKSQKNALFAGHDEDGKAWGRIASLIETAKINGVEPFTYLKATLEAIATGHPKKPNRRFAPLELQTAKLKKPTVFSRRLQCDVQNSQIFYRS